MRFLRAAWVVGAIVLVTVACNTTTSSSSSGGSGSCPPCELQGTNGECIACNAGQHAAPASATDLHGCSTSVAGVTCCPGACTSHTQDVTDFIAAVTNGPTIADATSYWVSQVHCNEGDGLKFVIAADGTARFNRDAAPVSWTRTAPDGMLFGNGPDGGAVFFSQMKNIYGSVADGSFNGVLLDVSGGHAGCGFGLVGGKM